MDESLAEAMHSGNSNAVEDKKITKAEFFQILMDETKKSAFSLHADLDRGVRKWEPSLIKRNEKITSPPAEESCAHDPLPSSSFLRRKLRQEEIAFKRKNKKMEEVWTNRGLPVDRETVCSAASEGAFDLKDLSESLPSTSASVNKQKVNGTCTRWREIPMMPLSLLHQKISRVRERHEQIRRQRVSRSSASERIPPASNSMKEILKSELVAQVWADIKRERREQGKDEKISKSELDVLRVAPLYEDLPTPHSDAEMSTDAKQDEKDNERQNPDAKNHLPRPRLNVFPPLLTNYVSKLEIQMEQSGWDTKKNLTKKFHYPDLLASLNSNVKKKNADIFDPFLSRKIKRAEARQKALRRLREQNKLKTLDSYRKVLHEDSSESNELSSEVSKLSKQDGIIIDNKEKYRLLIRKMEKSIWKDRPFPYAR